MDVLGLYQDYSVDFVTEGHKHTREGWVNTECPFCEGNRGYHLGFHIDDNYYHCWRCGGHPVSKTLALLLHIPEKQAKVLMTQYGGVGVVRIKKPKIVNPFKLPSNVGSMLTNHRIYLRSRGFNPEVLEREWGLLGTGPVSKLDDIDYKHRIIIPFIWNGEMVSFDSRDITKHETHQVRYKACPKERETIPHKEILYGKQEGWTDRIIIVEGPTDVWRFGVCSAATSGIQYTPAQVRVLSKSFKRIAVCYDDDPQATIQANKLVADLKFRGVNSFRVDIKGDPGSMSQEDADYLVKQLIH